MDALFDPLRSRLLRLNEVGVALSAEPDPERLLERILESARELTRADGGTLYLRTRDDRLRFAIMQTEPLTVRVGGTQGETVSPPAIPCTTRPMPPTTGWWRPTPRSPAAP